MSVVQYTAIIIDQGSSRALLPCPDFHAACEVALEIVRRDTESLVLAIVVVDNMGAIQKGYRPNITWAENPAEWVQADHDFLNDHLWMAHRRGHAMKYGDPTRPVWADEKTPSTLEHMVAHGIRGSMPERMRA